MQRFFAIFLFFMGISAMAQDHESIRGTFIESADKDLGKEFLLGETGFFKETTSGKVFILSLRSEIYVRVGSEYLVDGIIAQNHLPDKWTDGDCKKIAKLAWPDLNSTNLKQRVPLIQNELKLYPKDPLLLVRAISTISDGVIPNPIKFLANIKTSKLVKRVDPIYPESAKSNKVSGYVTLLISIDEEGGIAGINVLRGDHVLIAAAIEAVRKWKYSPTLIDGSPVRCMAAVNVIFRLR